MSILQRLSLPPLICLAALAAREPEPAPPKPTPAEYVPPKGYVCYRAAGPVVIDGRLDDAAWQAAQAARWDSTDSSASAESSP